MNPDLARCLADLHAGLTRPWTLMEVCGGQTHSLLRWGLDQLLPQPLRLIHGPGCPLCVTPAITIDQALQLAAWPEVILCSFGDMLRVPGSDPAAIGSDLLQARAQGGDVRLLTAPLQAIDIARCHPDRQVVFLAVGFETTAPATALLAQQVLRLGLANLTLLLAHVRVVPAMDAILTAPGNQVEGFLAAGHVAAVMGTNSLERLVRRHQIPVVVTGFAPLELAEGLLACVQLLEAGRPQLVNAYAHVVQAAGNPTARRLLAQVFMPADGPWRGLGQIAGGVLQLRPPYHQLDARRRFALGEPFDTPATAPCHSAAVLQGRLRPSACPSFGAACTPEHPLGAPMVSSAGACAAYYAYHQ